MSRTHYFLTVIIYFLTSIIILFASICESTTLYNRAYSFPPGSAPVTLVKPPRAFDLKFFHPPHLNLPLGYPRVTISPTIKEISLTPPAQYAFCPGFQQRNSKIMPKQFKTIEKEITLDPVFPKMIERWVKNDRKVFIIPNQFKDWVRLPLVTTDQQTLTWRIFNQAFWSERHFPPDHPICKCGLCPYEDADLEHKYFGCLTVSRFWTQVVQMLGLTRLFCPKFDLFFMTSLKHEPKPFQVIAYYLALWTIHTTGIEVIFDDAYFSPALMKEKFRSLVEKACAQNFGWGHTVPGAHKDLKESFFESMVSHKGIQWKDVQVPPLL
ncbi:hypothetical protein DSO57_1032651 [Entomophthora muscae]|uniref:Uncharacterized protein n=1 Tax=Entomophthora muscae TaxID=34485 RepID=A0ACC2U9U9_9FUNG|nr:hypothetical protein DSO57_1032651 [Entomophthora muscae]